MRNWMLMLALALGASGADLGRAMAAGTLEVTETSAASISRGQTFEVDSAIKLPRGEKITVQDVTSHKTAVCVGPYEGPVGKCPGEKRCGLIWRLLGRCGAAETATPGGTRGVRP
jgi:hypothetical protein